MGRFSDEEPQYRLSSSSTDIPSSRADLLTRLTTDSRPTAIAAAAEYPSAAGSSNRKSVTTAAADYRAKSDTLKRKAGPNGQQSTLSTSAAAVKSETLKRKSDGHQIFGTAEFNSRNRKSVAVAASGGGDSAMTTLRRKSEDGGGGGGKGRGVSAADELSEYLLRQSVDSSSYGLLSRRSTDKSDTFTTVHFSEIPRPKLVSTGTLNSTVHTYVLRTIAYDVCEANSSLTFSSLGTFSLIYF